MLIWSLGFLLVAIIAGILAFSGIVVAVTFISKILFAISLLCFLGFLVLHYIRKMQKKADKSE